MGVVLVRRRCDGDHPPEGAAAPPSWDEECSVESCFHDDTDFEHVVTRLFIWSEFLDCFGASLPRKT